MERAYRLAAAAVRRRYADYKPEDLAVLNGLSKKDVSVFPGTYDHVHLLLDQLDISYTFDPSLKALGKSRVAFVNCAANYSEALKDASSPYAKDGGWLVTSDWALGHLVESQFPGTISWSKQSTADEVVGVEPALDTVWADVVVLGTNPQWWLESASHVINVNNTALVNVEAASHEMLKKYEAPVIGASFDWGAGHVFHVISHFWLKRTRTVGGRHAGPATDFLREGMGLTDGAIAEVGREAEVSVEELNFAMIQSAVTSTELVAGLCVRAVRAVA